MRVGRGNTTSSKQVVRATLAAAVSVCLVMGMATFAQAESAEDSKVVGGGDASLSITSEGAPLDATSTTFEHAEDSDAETPSSAASAPTQAAASVPLSSHPKPATGELHFEGLIYSLLPDGQSVALCGWYGEALPVDVVVPDVVASGADAYRVVALENPARTPDAQGKDAASDSAGIFRGATFTSLTLPASVSAIADGVLDGCTTLRRILVSSKNETFATSRGMLFSKDLSELLLVPEGMEGVAILPDETVTVPVSAFSRCTRLSAVEVGEGSAAFSSRNGLLYSKDMKTLLACPPGAGGAAVVPEGVEAIASGAFVGCEVASLTVLGDVREIALGAFDDAAKDAVVALPGGEGYDARRAVWEAAGFSHITEPARPGDTTEPGDTGDPDDPSGGEAPTSGLSYTLLDDYTLEVAWAGQGEPPAVLEVPAAAKVGGASYRVSAVAPAAFFGNGTLEEVRLPAGLLAIGEGAFAGCANLSKAALPDGLQILGSRAFEATGLAEAWLPVSVREVGARALASCESLVRVVALGTPEVAPDVLAECSGVTVYCPLGSEDAWNVGLPAAGNHVAPYGAELASEPLALVAGETADVLEGGSVEAPEPVETVWSYAATPVSVDAGQVTGKAKGTTEVALTLSLDGVELARASRTVEVSPGEDQDGADVPMINQTATLMPSAYLAGVRAAAAPVSVTAPLAVVFGGAGYDVSNPQQSVTASATFQNASATPVYMTGLTCTDAGASSLLQATSGTLASQKIFSLYPGTDTSKAMDFGYGSGVNSAAPASDDVFSIAAYNSLSCTYRLNLKNAKVSASAADGGATVQGLANVSYTFGTAIVTPGAGTGSTSADFYLKNNTTGQVYTAAEVKAHADAIAAGDAAVKAAYDAFMADESAYECKVKWGDASTYDVRVIGTNHDKKSNSSAKAGLTFQFVNLLNAEAKMNSTNTNAGGWRSSELRTSMNSGFLWSQVPSVLKSLIASVDKQYQSVYNSTAAAPDSTSSDKLFLASACELCGSMSSIYGWGTYPWIDNEGYQYEYWRGKGVTTSNYTPLKKSRRSSSDTWAYWWERSVCPDGNDIFYFVTAYGEPYRCNITSSFFGVCPCFCL